MIIWHMAKFHFLAHLKQSSFWWVAMFLFLLSMANMAFLTAFQDIFPLPNPSNIIRSFGLWNTVAFFYFVFKSSGIFQEELTRTTFVTAMARPIAFWKFQLGHVLGLFILYFVLLLLFALTVLIKTLYLKIGLPEDFFMNLSLGIIPNLGWIILFFALGCVFSKGNALALVCVFFVLSQLLGRIDIYHHPLLKVLKSFFYMISPTQNISLDDPTLLVSQANWRPLLQALAFFAYTTLIFIFSNILYLKKDFQIRKG